MNLPLKGKEFFELGLIFLQEAVGKVYSIAVNLEAVKETYLKADIEGKKVISNLPSLEANLEVHLVRNAKGNTN